MLIVEYYFNQSINAYQILKSEINKLNFSYFDNENKWQEFCAILLKSCYFIKEQISVPKDLQKKGVERALYDFIIECNNRKMEFEFVKIQLKMDILIKNKFKKN
ncbi:hypothetical protein [Candidatus Stoquefichus sp. SB1]|uniref:hypothetical protein n=1 Tax=Candidatus Stoquefichus sp. SB1 TaxID=1658109 RepID=UPI00067F3604|nr:hypothetical protein [Candidatus Stoquefichus sp. SB1]